MRSSSAPVRRLNPTISTAGLVANFEFRNPKPLLHGLLQVDLIYRLDHPQRPLFAQSRHRAALRDRSSKRTRHGRCVQPKSAQIAVEIQLYWRAKA
jgi:hypothetical protein